MFKEAITDLSIAINLNKDLLDVSDALITIILGLSQQRKVCVPDRRHRPRLHGLPEADRARAGKQHISHY